MRLLEATRLVAQDLCELVRCLRSVPRHLVLRGEELVRDVLCLRAKLERSEVSQERAANRL
eukprot:5290760-Pleurochrysis_carterae.AAC.7